MDIVIIFPQLSLVENNEYVLSYLLRSDFTYMEKYSTAVASWPEHYIVTTYINLLSIAHKHVYCYNHHVAP